MRPSEGDHHRSHCDYRVARIYEIGPFRLDAEAGVLARAGVPVALGARAVAVLATLVARTNEYIQKDAILDAAWPGVVVEESNLAVQISAIRRVLAQVPGGERWIETLARRGYRFVGPVGEVPDEVRDPWADERRSNLPEPMTTFIGRERELVEIKRLLPGKRLVTIVGVGGIGKTRLALQVAAEAVDAYRDGVWLVELGSISDPSLVPTSVAQVVGVREVPGTDLTDSLCVQLSARQLLLILDNCEHVLEACATLVNAVLPGVADVTIIATSREPLRTAGEQIYPMQPLSLPGSSTDAESVGRSEAVQLFVERAQRQLPDFALTAAQAPAVAELCIHLDGIPLALELAAARLRSLSIEQINARLNDRFKLLTSGTRTALPRQQTLRATLDWSYDLLTDGERAVLRRLAVFAGGFTLEAAASVAADCATDEFAVIDLLSRLVSRSLVVAETNEADARYRLLESTRAYAWDKLAEAEDIDRVKRRHADFFRELFGRASEESPHTRERRSRAVCGPELDNVRCALDWALGPRGDPLIAGALAGASGMMWQQWSLAREGRQRLEAAAALLGPRTPARDQAQLWFWLGVLSCPGFPPQSAAALERSIAEYRRLNDSIGLATALVWLGRIRVFMGRFEQAAPLFAEAFPMLEHADMPSALAGYFENFGFLMMLTGNLASARLHFEKALSLYRSAGPESATLAMLLNLADMTWALGDLDGALDGFREALALTEKSPFAAKGLLGSCFTNLAGVHTERGELPEALAAAREGLPLRKEVGHAWVAIDHLALRAALAGKLQDAARLAGFADSMHLKKETSRQPNEARAQQHLHSLLHEKLDTGELARLLAEGAKLSEDEACVLALKE
jgi:predicted ATPase/DNA-binding winged helix-turn-helix (wHTH) protein